MCAVPDGFVEAYRRGGVEHDVDVLLEVEASLVRQAEAVLRDVALHREHFAREVRLRRPQLVVQLPTGGGGGGGASDNGGSHRCRPRDES